MGRTIGADAQARRYGPAPRTTPESGGAYRALAVVRARVAQLLSLGKVAEADTFVAPLLADFDAIAGTGDPLKLHSDAAIADDGQDVARERYRRGEITGPAFLYHLQMQLRFTLAEMREVRARMDA